MRKSTLDEPFNTEEKEELVKKPQANSLLMKLNPNIYNKKTLGKQDFRLTFFSGSRIILKDINYPGKGVKTIDLRLTVKGVEIVNEWVSNKED